MGTEIQLLYEILHYERAQTLAAIRDLAAEIINSRRKAEVYSLMDGTMLQKEIVDELGFPQSTVSRSMREFVKSGLAAPAGDHFESHKALFTLDELGIDPDDFEEDGA